MDFKGYWKNGCFGECHDIHAKNLVEQFYEAGQQSKQAEIDALKNLIDKIVGIVREADLSDGDSSVAIVRDEIEEILK